ncbi:MAG TPA: DegV family protein [Anaerolineae bacterium]|nr:DegV family protein [Anaerolineae bacterium]
MIRIVTDSTSDIPDELVRELDITVVPAYIIFGTTSYIDGVTLKREAFYRRLASANPMPTTSSPSAGDFEAAYRQLLNSGAEAVISIHVAAALSGVQNAARSGAGAVPELKVCIFDSEQVTMGLGWQVIEAARAARAGKTVAEILDVLERIRSGVRVFAALDTLEFVRRSGRVSWARAAIGQLLRIKPLVEVRRGAVLSIDRARTRGRSLERLKELLAEQGPLRALTVLHTRAYETAAKLADEFHALYPALSDPIHVVEATTAIGAHTGPNALGVACVVTEV